MKAGPVYIVSERRRLERRHRLREQESFATVIPAFMYNINKVVAPFVIVNPLRNTVRVKFATTKREPIHFTGKVPIPIQINPSHRRKEVHKAKCASFVRNQDAIVRYGKRLHARPALQ